MDDKLREAIARIIDPEAWEEYLLEDGRVDQEVASIFQDAYEESLAKSDNVLGLIEAAWNTRLQALEGAWEHHNYEGEVLVNGDWMAGVTAEGLCDVEAEVAHYAAQYASEGPVEVVIWECGRRRVPPRDQQVEGEAT